MVVASFEIELTYPALGIIQTMNYAINGRHLANQDYNICVRSEESEYLPND